MKSGVEFSTCGTMPTLKSFRFFWAFQFLDFQIGDAQPVLGLSKKKL
jgi:hypothetical protein